MVLYNGDARWQATCAIEQMIHAPDYLQRWQPRLEFLLLDEDACSKEARDARHLLIAAIFELDTVPSIEEAVDAARRFHTCGNRPLRQKNWKKVCEYGSVKPLSKKAWKAIQ